MPQLRPHHPLSSDLKLPWLLWAGAVVMLLVLLILSQTLAKDWQHPLPENTREWLRTALFVTAIITLPITNLLRYTHMRVYMAMPLEQKSAAQATKHRYFLTLLVSTILVQSPAFYGFLMFLLGDPLNILIIFALMSALGLYLYRPKADEYQRLLDALTNQDDE